MENTCDKTDAAILRQKAEDSLKRKPSKPGSPFSEGDSLKLIHELQVYHIELELQNEELLLAKSAALDIAEKYTELYDFAPSGYFTISKDDEIIELNFCGSQMLGKERSQLKNKRLGFFISDDTKPIYKLFMEKVFTSKVKESCEATLSAYVGLTVYVHLTGIFIDKGEQCHITMFDITARKQAEQALLDSERHYRALVEGIPGIVYSFSNKRGGMFYSDQVNSILGYSPEQLYAQPMLWYNSIHPDERYSVDQLIRDATTCKPFCIEYRIRDALGNWHWFEDRSTGYHFDGNDAIVEGLVLDITERKRAEEALRESDKSLRASLEEKDVLLKEVHHRVKNNLAAIIGLLDLQSGVLDDEPAKAALEELSNRIRSMSLVHEQLYQSKDLSQIDFQDYLDRLIAHLGSSYQRSADIHISVAAKGVKMGLDNAIPCGLLITELVTNAFKYAFPADMSRPETGGCEIVVSIQWDGTAYTLVVADNGVGLPVGLDWTKTKTLGLVLVKMLGQRQLQGEIEVDCTGGTTFRLRFAPPIARISE